MNDWDDFLDAVQAADADDPDLQSLRHTSSVGSDDWRRVQEARRTE
jgi:hypothetical protein